MRKRKKRESTEHVHRAHGSRIYKIIMKSNGQVVILLDLLLHNRCELVTAASGETIIVIFIVLKMKAASYTTI